MPNWCKNNLMITGPISEIQQIKEDLVDDNGEVKAGLCDTYCPFPEELAGETITFPNGHTTTILTNEGYVWQAQNWGTKWGDCDLTMVSCLISTSHDYGEIFFTYDTPWAPISKAVNKMAAKFPNCTMTVTYEEEAMGFVGADAYRSGLWFTHEMESPGLPHPIDDESYEKYSEQLAKLVDLCLEVVMAKLEMANAS